MADEGQATTKKPLKLNVKIGGGSYAEKKAQVIKSAVENVGKSTQGKKGEGLSNAMKEAGYSESYSKNPQTFKKTKTFREVFDEIFPDEEIAVYHKDLIQARKLDHMVFPTTVEDELIEEFLTSTNCVLRKIVHSTQSKHAYFWAYDNKARKDALDMAYKIKGAYAPTRVQDVTENPLRQLSDGELVDEIKKAQNFLKKR